YVSQLTLLVFRPYFFVSFSALLFSFSSLLPPPTSTLFPYTTLFRSQIQTHHERQKQPYGRQHTYHHYRTQRPAYEKTESLPRAGCGYPSAYGSQALGIEKE